MEFALWYVVNWPWYFVNISLRVITLFVWYYDYIVVGVSSTISHQSEFRLSVGFSPLFNVHTLPHWSKWPASTKIILSITFFADDTQLFVQLSPKSFMSTLAELQNFKFIICVNLKFQFKILLLSLLSIHKKKDFTQEHFCCDTNPISILGITNPTF